MSSHGSQVVLQDDKVILLCAIHSRIAVTDFNEILLQVLMNRVILALCGVCIRLPNGLNTYFSTAQQLISTARNAEQAVVGISMLTVLPEEVENADVSRALQTELSDQLQESSSQFAQLVDQYCPQALASRDLFLALLKQSRAWLNCGLTLSKLYLEHRPTFELVCTGLQTSDVEIITQSCAFIKELIAMKEYPRPAVCAEALAVLLGTLNNLVLTLTSPFIAAGAIDTGSEQGAIIIELCNTYSSVASQGSAGELLCTGYSDPSIETVETTLLVGFYTALSAMIRLKPRTMAFSTFDFWTEFQDHSVTDWHPHVRENAVYDLFTAVVSHATYPKESVKWTDNERDFSEDQEDFVSFRDARLGIQDILTMCLNVLKSQFFTTLQSHLQAFESNPSSWMQLEVVLYVLYSSMDAIKEIVMKLTYHDKAYQRSILQFLYNITALVLSLPASYYANNRLMHLYQSVCKYLGSLTFLLTSNVNERTVMQLSPASSNSSSSPGSGGVVYVTDFYFSALRSVLEAAACSHPGTSSEAAKAVHKLSVHGCKKLTAMNDQSYSTSEAWQTLVFIVNMTGNYVQNPDFEASSLLILIESVIRCVMEVPVYELKCQMLLSVGESIIQSLKVELQRPGSIINDTRMVSMLSLASQLIRFSDVASTDMVATLATHPLVPFLSAFWPVLQTIATDSRAVQFPSVSCAIFGIFGKVLMSAGFAVLSEVPNITNAILSAAAARGGSTAAALQCAAVLVECLGSPQSPAAVDFESRHTHLLNLITSITDMYTLTPVYGSLLNQPATTGSTTDCMQLFGVAYEAMESYFALIHKYLIFCRDEFTTGASQLSEKVMGLCCVCLTHCVEKDPLRPLLQVLQSLFVPPSKISENGNLAQTVHSQHVVLVALGQYGARLVKQLLFLLSAGRIPSALVPNITETLYCLLIACETPTNTAQTQTLGPQCRLWLEEVVYSSEFFAPLTELPQRQLLLFLLVSFAESRSRRFKSLVQDLYKICSSELTVDTLMAYA